VSLEIPFANREESVTGLANPPARVPPPRWAALLGFAYERARLSQLELELLVNDQMPQPYRDLLVHSRDMTPTLERFFGQRLDLTPLRRQFRKTRYWREVTLNLQENSRPV
jgi:hypothetical protein